MAQDEFKCITKSCGHVTIVRRSINDKPLSIAKCEECNGMSKYVISAHQSTPGAWVV